MHTCILEFGGQSKHEAFSPKYVLCFFWIVFWMLGLLEFAVFVYKNVCESAMYIRVDFWFCCFFFFFFSFWVASMHQGRLYITCWKLTCSCRQQQHIGIEPYCALLIYFQRNRNCQIDMRPLESSPCQSLQLLTGQAYRRWLPTRL